MKTILESWRRYLTEEKKTINSKEELIDIINQSPDKEICLDNPKGTTKKFGGANPRKLPFDYGEYPELTNPADGMGWDIILLPGSTKEDKNLLPVGHVSYYNDETLWNDNNRPMPENIGDNHKILICKDGNYSGAAKTLIEDFFDELWQFKEVVWYDQRSTDREDG
tara:strand:+ start:2280 stop:2777 length:498 start_codon:yes stop_codon:yes gene_type:complete